MPDAIRSPIGAAPVHHASRTVSTMDDARRLVRNGAPNGTVVVADHQSAGRGRRAGRSWHSAPCESLMFTIALERPEDPVTRSLVVAAAVARLLETRFGLSAMVKWPNDVLVAGRKICGILADHEDGWLYLGVGLNLRQTGFPPELERLATSARLELDGRDPRIDWSDASWPALRDALLLKLIEGYLDAAPVWHDVLSDRLWMKGEPVEVAVPRGEPVRGRLAGIAPDGCLVVEADRVHRLAAGEVSLSRKEPYVS